MEQIGCEQMREEQGRLLLVFEMIFPVQIDEDPRTPSPLRNLREDNHAREASQCR